MPKMRATDLKAEWFTTGQVAEIIGNLSRQSILRKIEEGHLRAERAGVHRRIARKDLIDYIRNHRLTRACERLNGGIIMMGEEFEYVILAILRQDSAKRGLTREKLRESTIPEEVRTEEFPSVFSCRPRQGHSMTLEDLSWTLSEFERAISGLHINKKVVLFRPAKGYQKDNGKLHIILRKWAPEVGADPEEVGDFQIARTQ